MYPAPQYDVVETSPGLFVASVKIGPLTAEGWGSSFDEAKAEAEKNIVHKILVQKVDIPSVSEQHTQGYYNSAVNMKTNKVMIGDPATDFLDIHLDPSTASLQDKSRKLFNNEYKSDVTFIVPRNEEKLQEVFWSIN